VLEVCARCARAVCPEEQRYRAYADVEVPLARGQHMLRPACREVLQALLPRPDEAVLDRGRQRIRHGVPRAMRRRCAHWGFFRSSRRRRAAISRRLAADVEVLDADALNFDSGARYGAIAVPVPAALNDARFERMLTPGGRLFVVGSEAPVMDARLVRRTARTPAA